MPMLTKNESEGADWPRELKTLWGPRAPRELRRLEAPGPTGGARGQTPPPGPDHLWQGLMQQNKNKLLLKPARAQN